MEERNNNISNQVKEIQKPVKTLCYVWDSTVINRSFLLSHQELYAWSKYIDAIKLNLKIEAVYFIKQLNI